MVKPQMLIVGAGPTGLMLALGLAKYGVRSLIVEKNSGLSRHSKAIGLHQRTREALRQWGEEERFLDSGTLLDKLVLRNAATGKTLFFADFNLLEKEAHRPGLLIMKQSKTEELLLEVLKATGFCEIRFGTLATGLSQKADTVKVSLRTSEGEEELQLPYVVGCDGASSFVRDALQLSFKGKTYPVQAVLADVRITDSRNNLSWPRFFNGKKQITVAIRIHSRFWRLIHLKIGTSEKEKSGEESVDKEDIAEWVGQTLGNGSFETIWSGNFDIHRRASPRFRVGRVLLAGDAAHIHSPLGGQGMNAGMQDAHNLSWKLAALLQQDGKEHLLDAYESERIEAVVKGVSTQTDLMTQVFLQSPGGIRSLAFFFLRRILTIPFLRNRFLRGVSMTNLRYTGSKALPKGMSVGKRLPDVMLRSPKGDCHRLYDLLPPDTVLLAVGNPPEPEPGLFQLQIGHGHYHDSSGLLKKLLNGRSGWILVRPDLHIACAVSSREKLLPCLQYVYKTY